MNRLKLLTVMLSAALVFSSCAKQQPLISGSINITDIESSSQMSEEVIPDETESSSEEQEISSEPEKEPQSSSEKQEEQSSSQAAEIPESKPESSSEPEQQPQSSSPQSSQETEIPEQPQESSKPEAEPKPPANPPSRRPIVNYDPSLDENELMPEEVGSAPQEEIKPADKPAAKPENNGGEIYESIAPTGEMRAVWISYLDFYTLLQGRSEGEFRNNIKNAFSNVAKTGLNTVIVQVRPFSDALYYSDIFPMSHIVTGEEGVDPGFDPLEIMIDYAHSYGLRIEAWINPYRVRSQSTKSEITGGSPAYAWLKNGDDAVVKHSKGVSYNPGSRKAQKLIVDGVAEIVRNYDVDGIHFDDYFYPTTEESFDSSLYKQYRNNGGKLSLGDYRRKNVDDLVKQVYSTIKSINPSVTFGISPQGNNDRNYNQEYIDVDTWLTNDGYVDYICPQIYYGFENSECPFEKTLKEWNSRITADVDLYVGLAVYKAGAEDKWAGEGKNEWINNKDMLKRMVSASRKYSQYEGFFLYRYDSLYNPASAVKAHVNQEISNLKSIF